MEEETKEIVVEEPVEVEETEEQKRAKELLAVEEARMSDIIETVREKVFPVVAKHNKTVPETKIIVESLAMVIQQGLYQIMKEYKVSALGLSTKYQDMHPDYAVIMELLSNLQDENLLMAIESLQWMGSKMDQTLKEENKERTFESLNIVV